MIDENEYRNALFAIHEGAPRGGPGSDETTRRALHLLPSLPKHPRVLDLGCGPGRQSLVLARELQTTVTAIDIFDGFLHQLKTDAEAQGLGDFIDPVQADMTELSYPPDRWDLIWSEGALYTIGFENGLRMCRAWLAPGGLMAVSECTWLQSGAPSALKDYWREGYPAMQDIDGNISIARKAGFHVVDHFVLDDDDWLNHYYAPLLPKMDAIENDEPDVSPAMKAAVSDMRREIELFRRYSAYYGYVFYLMQAAEGDAAQA